MQYLSYINYKTQATHWKAPSHLIINYIPHHLDWDKPFSPDCIFTWIWTNKKQCWQASDLKQKDLKWVCFHFIAESHQIQIPQEQNFRLLHYLLL
jgi:hypothetical protein